MLMKNKHLMKKAIAPIILMGIFGVIIALIIIDCALENKWTGGLGLAAFCLIFFMNGFITYRRLKKADELTSKKTIHNYMKINGISDANHIYCAHCNSNKISNRNHMTKIFREFYCSMCGETLYYVERKDFI